jgi:hypothetical protein
MKVRRAKVRALMRNRRSSLAWGVPLLGLLVCCTAVTDGAGAWSPAERIADQSDASSLSISSYFQVALDAGGNGMVAWADASNEAGSISSRRHAPGGGWSPLQQIDRNERDAWRAELAVDPNGNVVAVWPEGPERPPGLLSIWANRYTVASGWETAERLSGFRATDPHVAVDSDGNAIAVWHQSDGERENIWANRWTPGDGWGAAERIETDDRGHAGNPRIAIDPDGDAIAVWHQSDGVPGFERADIWANHYTPNDGWGNARRIENNEGGETRLPQVAMDPEGNAVVVWHQSEDGRFDIWSNRYVPEVGWGNAERIDDNDTGDADYPKVGVDANGHAIAVWKQFEAITVEIWANRYAPGVGWGGAERIENNDEGDALRPRMAVSANGDAIAVWPQVDGSRYDVWSNAYTPGRGWGDAERIDPSNEGPGQPVKIEVAIDPNGNALAVWLRRDPAIVAAGTQTQLWSARYE